MRACVLALLGCLGCAVDRGMPEPTGDPHACSATISLVGGDTSSPTKVGPLSVDLAGTSVCMHLDTTHNLQSAHFAAQTPYEAGDLSSFNLTLVDADGNPLGDGWDVTVGQTSPQTSATIEYSFAVGQQLDARLELRARDQPAQTMVNVSLFEPFE